MISNQNNLSKPYPINKRKIIFVESLNAATKSIFFLIFLEDKFLFVMYREIELSSFQFPKKLIIINSFINFQSFSKTHLKCISFVFNNEQFQCKTGLKNSIQNFLKKTLFLPTFLYFRYWLLYAFFTTRVPYLFKVNYFIK